VSRFPPSDDRALRQLTLACRGAGCAEWRRRSNARITHDGIPVANISKRWFRVRESYGVAVAPGQDDALILAVTVCIDHLTD
jgi:hypothetical protein